MIRASVDQVPDIDYMDSDAKKMFREYAWEYFKLHAGQRLQTFNFFLIVAGLLAGGTTALVKETGPAHGITIPLGLALTALSFVFWMLEQRTKHLVKNAEAALKYLDSLEVLEDKQQVTHVLRLFDHDDHVVKVRGWCVSYSRCFNIIFLVFGLLGIVLAVAGVLCH
jgi:hypothetical protein